VGGVSLQTGWLPWTVLALGGAGAIYLLCRPTRWWWLYVVPIVVVTSGVAAWLIGDVGGEKLFAKPLNTSDIVWIAAGLTGIGLTIGYLFGTPWWRKILAVLAALVLVAAAGNEINRSYVQFPAVRDLFGVPTLDQVSGLPPIPPTPSGPTPSPASPFPSFPASWPARPLTTRWTPTGPDIPADGRGKIGPITIPNTQSGFNARPGWVYLPPAYFARDPQPLPVLLLLHGQPGSPDDWLKGDRVQTLMNDFAAQHNGIAPVVVMPDPLGSELANPLCADTSLGKVDTYLAQDVPTAIHTQLRVDPDPRHWVVGGFSYGGTCALQMATNHPDVYPNFIDISGQHEPTLGTGAAGRKLTVDTAFGGDQSKFTAINPADLLASKTYPTSAGWFIWGGTDPETKTAQQQLAGAAQTAGMTIQQWAAPGTGHDWATVVAGLSHAMPWMATQMNLTR
jgi:S-formylglutathione hydrolase FrmB